MKLIQTASEDALDQRCEKIRLLKEIGADICHAGRRATIHIREPPRYKKRALRGYSLINDMFVKRGNRIAVFCKYRT